KEETGLVDALPATRQFEAHDLKLPGLRSSLVIDSPALGASAKDQRNFGIKSGEFDLILWTLDARERDNAIDVNALAGVRKFYGERAHRRQPPILVALTHIDALPASETLREARELAAAHLELAFEDVVPLDVAAGRAPKNLKELIDRIV